MSARTYICLNCRWSRRAEAAYGLKTSLRCPTCKGSLWELEWRWRIPRKVDDKAWKELEAKVSKDAVLLIPKRRRAGESKLAKLDAQMARVAKKPNSNSRMTELKKLRHEREQTLRRYA